jgi:hypothetical protein
MNYAKYLDIPNWQHLQKLILNFREEHSNKDALWWSHTGEEIKQYIPELTTTFANMGLTARQMIFFTNLPNDINIDDSLDPKAVFIHTDHKDNPDARYDSDLPILTDFETTNAVNIPLLNCEGSTTLFYKLKNDNPDVFYTIPGCGGHAKQDVEEVFRIELSKPAVLRINVPHAVWNPHNVPRVVATFRFYESTDHLL